MKLDHTELMRFHDGELPPERASGLERLLRANQEARDVLAGLEQTGAALRSVAEGDQRADPIADSVMARIAAERSPAPAPRRTALWKRAAPVGGLVLAMAAAAVMVLRPGSQAHAPAAARVVDAPPAPAAEPATQEAIGTDVEEASPAVTIESVDFGSRDGTIFMVESGESETPVVWLVDDSASPGARISPL